VGNNIQARYRPVLLARLGALDIGGCIQLAFQNPTRACARAAILPEITPGSYDRPGPVGINTPTPSGLAPSSAVCRAKPEGTGKRVSRYEPCRRIIGTEDARVVVLTTVVDKA
jgi:hypothetical protein